VGITAESKLPIEHVYLTLRCKGMPPTSLLSDGILSENNVNMVPAVADADGPGFTAD